VLGEVLADMASSESGIHVSPELAERKPD